MAEFFNKIAAEIQQASEDLNSILSDFVASGGGAGGKSNFDASGDSGSYAHEFDISDMDFDGMTEDEIQQLLAEDLMQNNPLQGIAEGVTRDIMTGQAQPENITEHLQAFRSAINWSEKFILGLIAFQIVIFFLCFYFSKKDRGLAPRLTLLVIIFIVVRSAEWLNEKGEEHWESFATQDYFDKRGVFVGIMLCGPLLVDVLLMLILSLREASLLVVQVKRTEIRRKKQNQTSKGGGKKKNRPKTNKQD